MPKAPILLSIQVGLPRQLSGPGRPDAPTGPWTSGIYKHRVREPVWLGATNLIGDGQADTKNHGGPDKAVLAYAAGHYAGWRHELDWPDLEYGAFGENFTVDGQGETSVCIGDTYEIGRARVQVSQPRQPCWKLGRRLKRDDVIARVQATGRSGWYLRVLEEGMVRQDLPLVLVDRPFPEWTVARAARVMHRRRSDPDAAAELAACPLLSAAWRARLSAQPTEA
jgi:MOSC domain-containing protein YiiM